MLPPKRRISVLRLQNDFQHLMRLSTASHLLLISSPKIAPSSSHPNHHEALLLLPPLEIATAHTIPRQTPWGSGHTQAITAVDAMVVASPELVVGSVLRWRGWSVITTSSRSWGVRVVSTAAGRCAGRRVGGRVGSLYWLMRGLRGEGIRMR